jgi:hypothetical protein
MNGKLIVLLVAVMSITAIAAGTTYLKQNGIIPELSMPIKSGTVLHYDKNTIAYALFNVVSSAGGTLVGSWNATGPVWVVFEPAGNGWSPSNLTNLLAPAHTPSSYNYTFHLTQGKWIIAFLMHARVTLTIGQTIQVMPA